MQLSGDNELINPSSAGLLFAFIGPKLGAQTVQSSQVLGT